MSNLNSFGAAATLRAGGRSYRIYRLDALGDVSRLPFSIKILLENLLRQEDGAAVKAADIEYVAKWNGRPDSREISFMPARVLLQDFTGVPVVVDLAALRDALKAMGADPSRANPLLRSDLVIDHSVQVDKFGSPDAFAFNAQLEFERNRERYAFLRWGQIGFQEFQRGAAGDGHCPSGQSRIPRPGGVSAGKRTAWSRPTRTRWWAPTRTPR